MKGRRAASVICASICQTEIEYIGRTRQVGEQRARADGRRKEGRREGKQEMDQDKALEGADV